MAIALCPATASAPGETSVATTAAADDLARERHGEDAAAGADVGDARIRGVAQQRQRLLDDELGFRARNEDGGRDAEVETPELADADDVGGRLTAGPPLRSTRRSAARARQAAACALFGQQPRAVPAEDRAGVEVDVDGRFVRRDAGRDQRARALAASFSDSVAAV